MIKALEGVNEQLEALKPELSDKIHTENVKCYRNIQDLFKGFEDQIEKIETVDKNIKYIKGITKVLTVLTAVDLVGVVALVLHAAGIL